MKVHEYQAKELLASYGAPTPKHVVCKTPDEVAAAFDQLSNGGGAMVKAQIHAGGRGAGQLLGHSEKLGGVKFASNRDKAKSIAELMFKYPLKTKQNGPEGQKISTIIVQADAEPAKEYYVAMTLDRSNGLPLLMASAEGGMDIEEVAEKHPEKIFKIHVSPETGLLPYQAQKLAFDLGFGNDHIGPVVKVLTAISKLYFEKDASMVEVNPLAVTKKGEVVVLDAKVDFDDNAGFRHKDLAPLRDLTEENPTEIRAAAASLNYIQLDGTIGCLVNGAGLAMATMDMVNYYGKEFGIGPANFLDVGGGVTAENAVEAFRIILSDSKVKAIFVNVFGGIASCARIAEALVKAGREVGFKVPVVVRLEGNEVEKAREILNAVKDEIPAIKVAPTLTDAAKMVVELAK
ncbi:MAG: ADP-forming succinate--CoA ligase subunit beta [Fimbriiglobus sp.]|jgi:succinyl-CoA synthetase beta subunit|nr:ADP-forming succinate--CoA ligase subunit beta [Fimbriiglobus sp.]